MKRNYEIKQQKTLEKIHAIANQNPSSPMAVIMRHSVRYFSHKSEKDLFMHLTPEGKVLAYDMGRKLDQSFKLRLYSSTVSRCVETAYLLDKGYCNTHETLTPHNEIHEIFTPFYVNDPHKSFNMVIEQGDKVFIRKWFNHEINESIMEPPEKTANIITNHMISILDGLEGKELALCISHDWNIYPLKEFKLGIKHEIDGKIGYLEGIVFFRQQDKIFMQGIEGNPVFLK